MPSRVENMELTRKARLFHGQCHCGSLRVECSTSLDIAAIGPRACDCSFCQKHGAAYVSDASGTLRVVAREARALGSYRQGSELARFQLCAVCGVLVAVVFEHVGRVYGAVNVGCLDERASFAAPVPASPQTLSAQDKVARWLQIWVPDVHVIKPASNLTE